MGRSAVDIEVILFDILPVIALRIGQPKQPLLYDRVLAVPHGDRKAQALMIITDPGKPILAPVIRARAGLIVREIIPRVAILAVVLAHRAPLALAEIRSPLLPRHSFLARLVEA